jgi:hypothetical protein
MFYTVDSALFLYKLNGTDLDSDSTTCVFADLDGLYAAVSFFSIMELSYCKPWHHVFEQRVLSK